MSTGPDPVPPPSDLAPVLPEKFLGLFRPRLCGGDLDTVPSSPFKVALNLRDLDLSQPVKPMPTGVKSSVQVFCDEAVALYSNPASDPNNITALKSLVNQLAEDFFLFRGYSMDYVYLGMTAIEPTALFDYLELTYDDDSPAADDNQNDQIIELVEDRMRPNCYTRIHGEPWDGYPEFFQHWDQANFLGSCLDSKDRTPGLLMLMPGNSGTDTTVTLTAGVLTLEDGRLVRTYDKPMPINCGCAPAPPTCQTICTQVNGCFATGLDGATVTVTYKEIVSFTITNGGAGYTSPPTVVLSSIANASLGNGGTATAVITGGAVTKINVVTPGKYAGTPTVTFSGGGGAGAAATVVMGPSISLGGGTVTPTTGQAVYNGMFNNGTNYVSAPLVTFTGGGSPIRTATAIANLGLGFVVSPVTLNNGGAGYTSPPAILFSPAGATATTRLTPTSLASIAVTTRGAGYTSNPTVTITGGNGTGATATATRGPVAQLTVVLGGTGYTTATVSFAGGGGTGAAATAIIQGGVIIALTLTDTGEGYILDPTVTITGDGTGVEATATARVAPNVIAKIHVTNGGAGYTQLPTVSITLGGGSGAIGAPSLTATSVGAIVLGAVGSYPFPTTVTTGFSGGGGAGAVATAVVKYKVASLTMNDGGAGYTSNPTAIFTGGGGSGANASIVVRHQFCVTIPTVGGYLSTGSKANYNPGTAITAISICDNTVIATPVVTLTPASGYTCNPCCPNDVQPVPVLPVTLFVNDGFGLVTLTQFGAEWHGSAMRTAARAWASPCGAQVANLLVPVMFNLKCETQTGLWTLTVSCATCFDLVGGGTTRVPVYPTPGTVDLPTATIDPDPPGGAPSMSAQLSRAIVAPSFCNPFSITVNFTFFNLTLNAMPEIYGTSSSYNMTITS